MRIVILVYGIIKISFDLAALRHVKNSQDWQYVLITTPHLAQHLSPFQRYFFDKIHTLETLTLTTLSPIIQSYLQHADAEHLNLVTSDETCQILVSELGEKFALSTPPLRQMVRFIDKTMMKQALQSSAIRCPQYMCFEHMEYQQQGEFYLQQLVKPLQFPLICKPVDSAGSSQVTKIHALAELCVWAKNGIQQDVRYEIDEYIAGTLYHCDSLVQNGEILLSMVNEYAWPVAMFAEGKPLGSIRLSADLPHAKRLLEFNRQALVALQPPDGATHLEVFWSFDEEPVFLEVGARQPGALIGPCIEKSFGFNMELEHLKLRLGITWETEPHVKGDYCFWLMIPKLAGKLKQRNLPDFMSAYKIEWHIAIGERYHPATDSYPELSIYHSANIAATIIAHHADFEILYRDFLLAKQHQWLTMDT